MPLYYRKTYNLCYLNFYNFQGFEVIKSQNPWLTCVVNFHTQSYIQYFNTRDALTLLKSLLISWYRKIKFMALVYLYKVPILYLKIKLCTSVECLENGILP